MDIFLLSPGSRLSPLRLQQGISVWPGFWDFGAATFARFHRFHPKDSTKLAILWLFQICVAVSMGWWDGMRIQHDSYLDYLDFGRLKHQPCPESRCKIWGMDDSDDEFPIKRRGASSSVAIRRACVHGCAFLMMEQRNPQKSSSFGLCLIDE